MACESISHVIVKTYGWFYQKLNYKLSSIAYVYHFKVQLDVTNRSLIKTYTRDFYYMV